MESPILGNIATPEAQNPTNWCPFWKYVLFKKGTVSRGGCPDTLDTPWIRPCNDTLVDDSVWRQNVITWHKRTKKKKRSCLFLTLIERAAHTERAADSMRRGQRTFRSDNKNRRPTDGMRTDKRGSCHYIRSFTAPYVVGVASYIVFIGFSSCHSRSVKSLCAQWKLSATLSFSVRRRL